MNRLSQCALVRAVVSAAVALALVLTASGAYAGMGAAQRGNTVNLIAAEKPAIVFTGSAAAPLVCTSTPDTGAVTITAGLADHAGELHRRGRQRRDRHGAGAHHR